MVISRYNPIGSYGGGDGGAFTIRGKAGRPGSEIRPSMTTCRACRGSGPTRSWTSSRWTRSTASRSRRAPSRSSPAIWPSRGQCRSEAQRRWRASRPAPGGRAEVRDRGRRTRARRKARALRLLPNAAAARAKVTAGRPGAGAVAERPGRRRGGPAGVGPGDLSRRTRNGRRVQDPGSTETPWPREADAGFRVHHLPDGRRALHR